MKNLILVLSLTAVQVLVFSQGLRAEFLSIQERELRRELELAPVFLESLGPVDPDSAAVALSRRVGFPVTFLDLDGRVYYMNSDGTHPTEGPQGSNPQWDPDGESLFVAGGSLHRM